MINNLIAQLDQGCQSCLNAFPSNPGRCSTVCSRPAGPGSTYPITSDRIVNPILPDNLKWITGSSFFASLLPALIGWILVIGSIGFVMMMLLGAIQWIFSGGDKGALESAKSRVTNALIGIIVLFSVFAVVNAVEIFFGINILTIDIGPLKIQ